ncbi:transglycosylase domain-containing protein [Fretibacter rubidus]|uniref:multimodular transpeptidase-transglycosylase PbpC n=1 Tax=Fretibacter rubidus TaxID=570162 RepID=UPI00352B8FFC
MQTYRADIDAVNDNRTRNRGKLFITIVLILAALGAFGYVQARAYLFDGLPSLPDKTTMWELNLQPNTTLLDKNGNVLGHRGPHVGRPLKLSEMPNHLPQAFLAIEDERFYQHAGIDRRAILRAFFENQKSGRTAQGGSTLTQQLVKNMVLTPEKTYRRKFQEAWLAYEMETVLSKPEILELYLNRVDLGNRTFGVEAAAQRYFGKSATEVTRSEAAMLAGLPQAPSRYNPAKNFDGAWSRAKLVLRRMLANTMITPSELAEAETNPPVIISEPKDAIEPAIIGHLFDYIQEQAQGLVGSEVKDLIVRTTIDPKLQQLAHDSVEGILSTTGEKRKVSEGALVTLDNQTGAVRAMVGGRDYTASKFNRAVQAERQPGSSFKAFVYATALEEGFTPATVRIDQPTEIAGWKPENYTRRYRGPMTIREALKLSINTVAAQVGAEIGPPRIVDLAKRFGITTNLRTTYSISLGASEVTLLDLSQAFMVFSNDGVRKPPYLIESVSNSANEVLYTRKALAPTRVYAESYARQMTEMLSDVVQTGTGHGAKLGKRAAGGKTGTTQDYRDAWFVGFTAQYTTGVWMGNDDNSSTSRVTGGLLPVDAWKDFMLAAHKGLPLEPLNAPQSFEDDEKRRKISAFYSGLAEALITERNLAAGITQPRANVMPVTVDGLN